MEEKRSLKWETLRSFIEWRTEERKAEDKTQKGNGRSQESALGHSQKIVAGWWKWVGEKTKTGDGYQMAQETHEERKTSLENMVATELLKLAMETDEERKSKTEEDGSYHSAEVSPWDSGWKKS